MGDRSRYVQGLILFFALVLFLGFIFWLSNQNIPFSSFYRLEVKFESVGGLLDQAKVLMRGYRVGSVKSARFEPDGVVLTLSIDKKCRIPVGSTFAIINYNFIGERAVSITPSQSGEFLLLNVRVQGENQDMMADAQAVFSNLHKRLASGQLEELEGLVSRLENFLENIRPQINVSLPPQFKEDLRMFRETAEEIRKTFVEMGERVPAVETDVRTFMEKMGGLLEIAQRNQTQLEEILKKLSTPDSSAGKFIQDREFWEMTKETLDKLNAFLKDLEKNPKKYFKVSIF